MTYNDLKMTRVFDVPHGTWHVEIWGKPEDPLILAPVEKNISSGDQIVHRQFEDLQTHYRQHHGLDLMILKQVHGNGVVHVACGAGCNDEAPEADAVVSSDPGVALAIKTADCIPVLFFHTQSVLFGAIHAGWRGLELEILRQTLNRPEFLGDRTKNRAKDRTKDKAKEQTKENLQFVIGPHIGCQNYETGEDVFQKFSMDCSTEIAGSPKRNLDVARILRQQFTDLGISETRQTWLNENTFGSPDYFSHRSGEPGRNFNVIFFKGK